jgi:GAF domain-containing protein
MLVEPMIRRLETHSDLQSALQAALSDAIALLGGEFGDIQLRTESGVLVMVGHTGLPRWFIESFSHIAPDGGTTCARAARNRLSVTVHDLQEDSEFRPFASATSAARSQAVISSPLISSADSCIGVISVYFTFPHTPTRIEIDALETYCGKAADYFAAKIGSASPAETAERIHTNLIQQLESAAASKAHAD